MADSEQNQSRIRAESKQLQRKLPSHAFKKRTCSVLGLVSASESSSWSQTYSDRTANTSQQWPQPLTILGGNSPRTEQVRYITIIIIIIIIIDVAELLYLRMSDNGKYQWCVHLKFQYSILFSFFQI